MDKNLRTRLDPARENRRPAIGGGGAMPGPSRITLT
jgi:hypothetical protein